MRSWVRLPVGVVAAAAVLMISAVPAAADPAGPTDYQNDVLGTSPDQPGVMFSVVGGDAFLRAEVDPGVELIVLGYYGEHYLKINPDGVVEQNVNSPSVILNLDRFGESTDYDPATAALPPQWEQIGSGGSWAWHDHRMHWMSKSPPPGRNPGDVVYDEVRVPVLVDGTPTLVMVSLTWLERPVPLWPAIGALLSLALVWLTRRTPSVAALAIAVAAAWVGAWQYLWLPPETTPSPLQWGVPLLALVFATVGLRRRVVAHVAAAIAAIELAGWGIWRWDALFRAILPTGAPFGFDRAVTAAALVGGIAILLIVAFDRVGQRSTTRSGGA